MSAGPAQIESLWKVEHLARYLDCSVRTIWTDLRRPSSEKRSIPHIRTHFGDPRFFPDEIRHWLELGCPPVDVFREWSRSERR